MAPVDISQLPLKYQQQALRKLAEQQKKPAVPMSGNNGQARTKFGNVHAERANLHFDSQKEARRYDELMLMLAAGQIRDLRLQVEFTLQAAYTTPEGKRIRAIRYLADFTYYRIGAAGDEYVVEDVKSKPTRTKVYMMKKKMMAERLGLAITEV